MLKNIDKDNSKKIHEGWKRRTKNCVPTIKKAFHLFESLDDSITTNKKLIKYACRFRKFFFISI